jgi:hypothetical protein
MIKQRRIVQLSELNTIQTKFGGHYKVYGYTKLDLANLLNCSVSHISKLISNKLLDPNNLISIINNFNLRN